MIVLAVTIFTMSASAVAAEAAENNKPFAVSMICTKSSQRSSGLSKVCYYNCGETEGALKVQIYDACPQRTLRWRLNRTGSFGPSVAPR